MIPKSCEALVSLAGSALTGAQAIGAAVNLQQNTATRIASDLHDLVGPNGAVDNTGKLAAYETSISALSAATARRRQAIRDGIEFCGVAVDLLKGWLGRQWNPSWAAAGFVRGSLEIRRDPARMLTSLRNYFRSNADQENASLKVTAARAETLLEAIRQAGEATEAARTARALARSVYETSLDKLRQRIQGLRDELDQLLTDDDMRWTRFGFIRPIEGRIPEPLTSLTLRPGVARQVQVSWPRAKRAKRYRVKWWVKTSVNPQVYELPSVKDFAINIDQLTSGTTVVVEVTAVNKSGPSQPVQSEVVVP